MNPVVSSEINKLARAARDWGRAGRSGYAWLGRKDAVQQREVHAQDAKDLLAVHDAAKAGDWKNAWTLARELDTIVRDQIPARLYDFLMKKAGAT